MVLGGAECLVTYHSLLITDYKISIHYDDNDKPIRAMGFNV